MFQLFLLVIPRRSYLSHTVQHIYLSHVVCRHSILAKSSSHSQRAIIDRFYKIFHPAKMYHATKRKCTPSFENMINMSINAKEHQLL
mmetsp:Transcript_27008/g.33144  ORF Transcript_27008/g.33144 Transcript_27008/m.33144 type:complete len:87 (+) Transcript_27008:64-324(+)